MFETEVRKETILEMADVGVLYGHKRSKAHPRMKQYVAASRNEIELLDPEAVVRSIARADAFLREVKAKGGLVLCVGVTPPAREAVKTFAEKFSYPYVITRWLGGTLTNFKVIADRMKYYESLKEKRDQGLLAKYTKKEQRRFGEEIGKLSHMFDGLMKLTRIPDALFVVDARAHETALREAKRMRVPVVAILDTDDNPESVEYPIFANDHGKKSIEWVMERLAANLQTPVAAE